MRGTTKVVLAVVSLAIVLIAWNVWVRAQQPGQTPEIDPAKAMEKLRGAAEKMGEQMPEQMPGKMTERIREKIRERMTGQAPVALEGFCPVSIIQMQKWVKGNPEFQTVYDGRTYLFSDQQHKDAFLADPVKFVPALGGDCVVTFARWGKRVPGDVHQAAFHNGRLFLFADEQAKETFETDPLPFETADLALGGDCPVCLIDTKERMPGKPEFAAIFDGMRYFFASEEHREKFLETPEKYRIGATVERIKEKMGEMKKGIERIEPPMEPGPKY
ncbi:MAG TPA: hypothetical protein VMY42_07900 [Thermoguttaceae bacterium]|nr:hypothetical protein [Thermoguttaceae bacterium]